MPPKLAISPASVYPACGVVDADLCADVARKVHERAVRLLLSGEALDADSAERLAELPGAGAQRLGRFNDRKRDGDRLADLFRRGGRADLGDKVFSCCPWLKVSRSGRGDRWRVETVSCSVRECPMCNARDAAKRAARLSQAVALVQARFPSARWIFLTLTVRNCPVGELRETIQAMNVSWQRLIKRRELRRVIGWSRSVEVTRGKDGLAHPHSHVLLCVPPSYFAADYITKHRWIELWRDCARLDYDPSLDVKAVKKASGDDVGVSSGMIAEVTKAAGYSVKPSEVEDDPSWMVELHEQQSKLRFFSTGGHVKDALKELGLSDDDDDDGDDVSSEDVLNRLLFSYNRSALEYRRSRR